MQQHSFSVDVPRASCSPSGPVVTDRPGAPTLTGSPAAKAVGVLSSAVDGAHAGRTADLICQGVGTASPRHATSAPVGACDNRRFFLRPLTLQRTQRLGESPAAALTSRATSAVPSAMPCALSDVGRQRRRTFYGWTAHVASPATIFPSERARVGTVASRGERGEWLVRAGVHDSARTLSRGRRCA